MGENSNEEWTILRIVWATALILVCAVGVAKAADVPDAWVTIKTKVALMTTEGISTKDLNVDTVNGVVTLHGKVATEVEKVKAADVARRIERNWRTASVVEES